MAVSQTMTSPDILEKLAAYVPGPVMQAIYRNPQPLTQAIHRRFPAAVLFSDISGFTPLSELLHKAGPTGAEDLTYFINQYFTQMIELIDRHQGQVVKFSGDALTALFPAEDYSMQIAVRLAGECALAMQAEMAGFARIETPRGAVSLSMKAGVGAGQVLEASIGGVLGRWEYVVCGDPLVQVALAERQAKPGQTIFSPQAWAMAKSYFSGVALADDFINVSQVRTPLTLAPPVAIDWSKLGWEQRTLAEKALQRYIPGAIKARLNEQSEWLAELRRMTTLFIGIGGFDFEADDAPEKLQVFLQATQELIYRFEGSLGKVAVDDKGTVLIILFGAPPFFHEDDARRGVACAIALQAVAREQGLRMSIGITEGLIFAGPVGAPNRREYTVIGDQVNLAARLMQYGRAGTILITERVKDRAGPHFITESLGRITLKGKTQTEAAYEV
ncbi:MAG: adenylate/guanylate cyclase domain-containing protein, partial [Anaerolineae bacterium]|nr:adenylate/guanylate cyclase domain-containing protein [Anaerolineae bacterium]